jgi:nucleoside-diphosphate-sugar epimerase
VPTKPLAAEDLDHVLTYARDAFKSLRNANLFITGGTGFFGHWLLESLLHANRELGLDVHATVLTRSAASFRARSPHIAHDPAISLLEGEIRTFTFPTPPTGEGFTHILHAATDSTGTQADQPAYALAESILGGTRRVLEFANETHARRLLYVSTGAVYGRSTTIPLTPETYLQAPDPLLLSSCYDEAKRMAENLTIAYTHGTAIEPVIARCFAFVGPHLPLTRHFAIGNFIHAAMHNEPIHIKGDGTPRRSWLYMADLAVWLWTLLTFGNAEHAFNVGSEEAYTIAQAAQLTADTLAPGLPIQIDGTARVGAPLNSYVPDVTRAYDQLGLEVRIRLAEALRRTAAWHKSEKP